MTKHKRNENAATKDRKIETPPAKVAKSTSVCEYCRKEFTTRGIPLHQTKCSKKQAHDKAEAKKTRSYKFCIVNEAIHEEILSFLNNQALTKMQMITGDHYQQCEPVLARYCCKCEDNNPAVLGGLCQQCNTTLGYSRRSTWVEKQVAKDKYGLREKDLREIRNSLGQYYDCDILEMYMIEKCGSKMGWVRYLAKRDMSKRKALATRRKNQEDMDAFLKSLAPGFAPYLWAIGFKKTDEELLMESSQRFIELKSRLEERGLHLPASSTLCSDYITTGVGKIEDVVRATETIQSSRNLN
ncbi:hypothetical protein F442_19436 [Phytophthora nicotianae P10297]|uniref:Uncharacterized protein n=1 Tax=Phytophthora nicotianae P10297 TaxID=1317064 RepID=W2YAJ7_PHYNI|nr:hypothetical protein F442_19436 [Phytophthora nicotianae P10297]